MITRRRALALAAAAPVAAALPAISSPVAAGIPIRIVDTLVETKARPNASLWLIRWGDSVMFSSYPAPAPVEPA